MGNTRERKEGNKNRRAYNLWPYHLKQRLMLQEADILSKLGLTSVKFHQLQLFKNTAILEDYDKNPQDFNLFPFEEYKEFIIDFLEKLNPELVIERFAGEVPPRFRANEGWGNIRNEEVVSKIEQRMIERNTYQGDYI